MVNISIVEVLNIVMDYIFTLIIEENIQIDIFPIKQNIINQFILIAEGKIKSRIGILILAIHINFRNSVLMLQNLFSTESQVSFNSETQRVL